MPCVNTITNGAPMVLFRGTEDQSGVIVPVEAIPRPQHLPIFIIQSQRGPLTPQIVFGAQRDLLYGSTTFKETGDYTNHQTIGSNICQTESNAHMLWRVSAGTTAQLLLSLEVTEVEVPLYQRDSAGKYLINTTTGALIPEVGNPVVNGYALRWVVDDFGAATLDTAATSTYTQAGMTNPTTVYPMLATQVENPGEFGNNIGIRLFADTRVGATDITAFEKNKAFPYYLSIMERATATSSPIFFPSMTGERAVTVTFSPTSLLRATGSEISTYAKTVLDKDFSNTTDTRYALKFSPFGVNTHVYQSNIDTVCGLLAAAESTYLTANPTKPTGVNLELLNASGSKMINFVSAKDQTDVPYYTITMDEAELPGQSVRLTQYTTVYCRTGTDNIMSVADYEAKVIEIANRYADCSDEVQDIARRPESIVYDTGFSSATKLEMSYFISQRPDIALVLSTHEDTRQVRGYTGEAPAGASTTLTLSEEIAAATLLQSRVRLIPESEYFGTPTSRAIIFAGSGVLRNSEWTARVPVTMNMLQMASAYMGAADGKWKSTKRFSRAPGSILTLLKDVTIPWVPADTRVLNWDVGINMAMPYNEQFMSMPSSQTVYPDDSSVLNVWLVTLAITYLNKIAHAAWREYRGVDDLTSAELEVAIDNFVTTRVTGIFDGKYLIVPNAEVTVDDELRSTSWHLNVKIGALSSRTTEIVQITAYRRADLEAITV